MKKIAFHTLLLGLTLSGGLMGCLTQENKVDPALSASGLSSNTQISQDGGTSQTNLSSQGGNSQVGLSSVVGISSQGTGTSSAIKLSSSSAVVDPGYTSISQLMTEAQFLQIYPILDPKKASAYSSCHTKHRTAAAYAGLVASAAKFPKFANVGSLEMRKRELAAFLANVAKETTGGWATAPGGYEAWGLCFVEEQGYVSGGIGYTTSNDPNFQAVAGKSYHGRGPIQISYPYNYGPFSIAIYGDKNVLLNNPEKVLSDPAVFWASAIWFWMNEAVAPDETFPNGDATLMEGKYYKPSAHMAMTETWKPRASDIAKNRTFGLGVTINIINGGLECGGSWDDRGKGRVKHYVKFTGILGVTGVPSGYTEANYTSCQNQTSFSIP